MKNLKLNNELAKIKEQLDILEKSNKRLSDELFLIKNPYKYEIRQEVVYMNECANIVSREIENSEKLYWIFGKSFSEPILVYETDLIPPMYK